MQELGFRDLYSNCNTALGDVSLQSFCCTVVSSRSKLEKNSEKSERLVLAFGNNCPSSGTVLMSAKHSYISQTLYFF